MRRRVATGVYYDDETDIYDVRTTKKNLRTGKLVWKTKTLAAGSTLEMALMTVQELKREVDSRDQERPREDTEIRTYAISWMKGKMAEGVARSTRITYTEGLEKLTEFMGGMKLSAVTRDDVGAWARWLEKLEYQKRVGTDEKKQPIFETRRYATSTLQSWWRPVVTMLKDASASGLIPTDPTLRVKGPDTGIRRLQEQETLSAKELGDFLLAAMEHCPGRYPELVTTAYTGMRPSELYGLKWEDIDWARELIHIRRSGARRRLRSRTKTDAERSVWMHELVAEALRDHQKKMIETQHPGLASGLVFPADNGNVRGGDTLRKPIALCEEKAGIDIHLTPKVFRRTLDTLGIVAGIDRIVQRSFLGHSSEEMTERYAGVRADQKKSALRKLLDEE